MSKTLVTVILCVPALAALVVLWRSLHANRSAWNRTATFIFVMAWLFVFPSVFGALLGGRTPTIDAATGNPVLILAPFVLRLQKLSNYLLSAVPILCLLRVRRSPTINGVAVVALFLALIAGVASALNAGPLLTKSVFTLMVALAACVVLPRGPGAAIGAAAFGVSFTAAGGLLSFFDYQSTIVPCIGAYKCGPLGVFVLGALESENAFGLVLCAALPFVWLAFTGRTRVFLFSYVFLMVYVCSSRTSFYAACVVATVLLVLRPSWNQRSASWRLALAALTALGGVVVGIALPFVTTNQDAYTERGLVWQTSRRYLEGHYVLGLGFPNWSSLVQAGRLPAYAGYSPHNQWLDILWVAGGLGAVLLGCIFLLMLRADFAIGVAVLLPVIFLGMTERIWGVSDFGVWSFAYLAALLVTRPNSNPPPITSPAQRRDLRGDLGSNDRVAGGV